MGWQNQHEYAARVWQSRTMVEVVQEAERLGCSDKRGRIRQDPQCDGQCLATTHSYEQRASSGLFQSGFGVTPPVLLLARVWVQLPSFPTANSFPPRLTLPCGRNRVSVLLLLLQATIDNLLQHLAEHRVPFHGALNLAVSYR